MKLLLDRGQKEYSLMSLVPLRFGSGNVFTIKAHLELEPEEKALIEKYKLSHAVIADGSLWTTLKTALPQALLVTFLAAIIVQPVSQAIAIASRSYSSPGNYILAIIFFVLLYLYYKDAQEKILVSELVNGWRTFRADTVVDLVHKEAYIESVCQHLQQLLITAKHWDDKAVIEIEPLDKEQAKQQVLEDTTYNPLAVHMDIHTKQASVFLQV